MTGASGFVGQLLSAELLNRGHRGAWLAQYVRTIQHDRCLAGDLRCAIDIFQLAVRSRDHQLSPRRAWRHSLPPPGLGRGQEGVVMVGKVGN